MKPILIILFVLMLHPAPVRADIDIFGAIQHERVEMVRAYLASDTNAVNAVAEKRCTLLHFAAEHSSSNGVQILEMLLAKGAKVEAKNHINQTPLFWAVIHNSIPATKVLLSHGAEVNAQQSGGWTPLHCAAINGYCEGARILIEKGADVKAQSDFNETPLMLAALELKNARREKDTASIKRYEEMVSLLRKSGSNK